MPPAGDPLNPKVVTKFTDYDVSSPDFFVDFIQAELSKRDLAGLTNDRIRGVNVTSEHPLVQLTGAALSSKNMNQSITGLLPAIAVVEADEIEQETTKGYGLRTPQALDQSFVDGMRDSWPKMRERVKEGLITDKQLDLIEAAIKCNDSEEGAGDGTVLAITRGYFQQETVMISCWADKLQDRIILGDLLRSIIFDMVLHMQARNLRDIYRRTAKGLVNMNFGRVLHGQETRMEFINSFRNFTVTDEPCLQNVLDKTKQLTSIDAVQGKTIVDPNFVDVHGTYDAASSREASGTATIHEDEEE